MATPKKATASKPRARKPKAPPAEMVPSVLPPMPEYPHSHPQPEGERVMLPGEGGLPAARSIYAKAPGPDMKLEQAQRITEAHAQRADWEKSAVGQARTKNINDLLSTQMKPAQIYAANDWDKQAGVGPKHYDRELPGMSDPHAAPRPPRWEEMAPETQEHTIRKLAEHGMSIEQMTADIGAQTDQAYVRASKYETPRRMADTLDEKPDDRQLPYATSFYSTGEPRQVLDASAKKLGIPQSVHAVMNAMTSPNTKFSQHHKGEGGEGPQAQDWVSYPNDETAVHVVRHVQRGGTHENLTNQRTDWEGVPEESGKRHQGYTTNMRKAANAYQQHEAGITPDQWRGLPTEKNPGGGSPWKNAPKTGPYANSWSDTHPQFFVSDVHSGGGGAAPHLGTEKPILRHPDGSPKLNEEGKVKRDKSGREKAIESVPFFHSAADYAARQAATQRGLGSLRDEQASQWGEEQLQRGEAGDRGTPKESQVYSTPKIKTKKQLPGQEKLF